MSLTIQAPHANMNGYEIGSDETRKNGVSDKGTVYAGDLQFAQSTNNAVNDMIFMRFQMEESSAGRVKDFVVFIVITDPFINNTF